MNYTFKIIDTQRNDLTTSVERAVGSSIILEWLGGDKKDELLIVGSRLSFTMVGMSMADGQYLDLFTGDETRYRVTQEDADGNMIWQGFLLPDSYEEPYSNAPILVSFQATDGLGRLKGKYLSEDFYSKEKSIIEIIAACLRLTGLDLSFRFAPAIENAHQRDYNQIYLDTSYFKSKDKKEDAYKILNDLLESMLCTVYQADNYYNIEGFNIRNMRVYKAKVYAPDGTLTDEVEVERKKVHVTGIATPVIAMQPPYGSVTVEHPRENISLPETLSKEKNNGWVVVTNKDTDIYALEWKANGNHFAFAVTPDYNVYIGKDPAPANKFISLRTTPYIQKAKKYRLELNFRLVQSDINDGLRDNLIAQGNWDNPFEFRVIIKSKGFDGNEKIDVLFANYGIATDDRRYWDMDFTAEEKSIDHTVEFVAQYSGVFDIEIHPVTEILTEDGIKRIEISEASLEELAFEETYTAERTLNEEYTLTKELELTYADDVTGFSKGFRLYKLRDEDGSYNEVTALELTLKYQRDGKYYVHLPLKYANLIEENIDHVYLGTQKIDVKVIYNINESEQHALEFDAQPHENLPQNPVIRIYHFSPFIEERGGWQEWTDSIYKVERIRYAEAAANILHRMFDKPVKSIPDFTVKNNIQFNSYIDFKFINPTEWMLTNCRWDIDNGFASVTAIENYYAVKIGENIPPVVEAGNDIAIGGGDRAALTCEAYDPDGFIVSYLWEEITSNGAVIGQPNSQNTEITGLIKDFYTFRVTVTDNDGATASDTVNVVREQNHELYLYVMETNPDGVKFRMSFEPRMGSEYSLTINGSYDIRSRQGHPFNTAYAAFRIIIGGEVVREDEIGTPYGDSNKTGPLRSVDNFSQIYIGDTAFDIEIEAFAEVGLDGQGDSDAYATFTIDSCEFIDGFGNITNLPVSRQIEMYDV